MFLLSLEYNGDIEYIENKINQITSQYSIYYNILKGQFMDFKIKFLEDDSYNYNKLPKDIRSNSIQERLKQFKQN